MPSRAYMNFDKNLLKDVNRLIGSHETLNDGTAGKKGLGHITRSGVVMLCAAWEVYLEDLVIEVGMHLSNIVSDPKELPKEVKKEISDAVKKDAHDLSPLEMAGSGWKTVYSKRCEYLIEKFNTPKSQIVDELFKKTTGVVALSREWTVDSDDVDSFVTLRGEIAHRGHAAQYVKIGKLKKSMDFITRMVLETDNFFSDYLKEFSPKHLRPWRRKLS